MAGSSSKSAMTVNASNGSKSPSTTTGHIVPNQMEMDQSDSIVASAQGDNDVLERELIPANSRISRLPSTVPSTPKNPTTTPISAISDFQIATTTSTSGQDVRFPVNTTTSLVRSPVISSIGQSSPLQTAVPSFTQPLTQNDIRHPLRRPRTSGQVFQSSTDLAAHYGIPQQLPPAPSTTPRYQPPTPPSKQAPFVDFQTLSQNYLNMLSNKPSEPTLADQVEPSMPTMVSAAEMDAPVVPSDADTLNEIVAMLASPEFRDLNYDCFMTSPMPGMETDFGVSPDETPYHDFLNTPLLGDDDVLITSPLLSEMPLFPGYLDQPYEQDAEDVAVLKSQPPATLNAPYTISPFSPALEAFDNPHTFPSATPIQASGPADAPSSTVPRRTSRATGIRKGVTPDSLLDEDAPTQSRKYATPSATSKKAIPATFARKRGHSAAFGADEEDQLDNEMPLNPTERDLIDQKRRQNTVAARRSRKRKLEQYQNMEKSRDEERQLKEVWKERTYVLLATLREHGVKYPDFPEDVQHFANV